MPVKQLPLVAILIVVTSSSALTQHARKESDRTNKAEQEVRQVENERVQALYRGDAKEIDRLYADDYIMTLGSGTVIGKPDELAIYTTGSRKTQSWEPEDVKIRVYGDGAVVTGRASVKDILRGQSRDFQFRFTNVWVKQHGRWQIVTRHGTRMAQPTAAPQLVVPGTQRQPFAKQNKKADGMSEAEQEVMQVDNKRNEALVRGDIKVLDAIWADDLILTNSRGEVHSKAQRIADIQSGSLKFQSYTNDDVLVRVYADTAVVIGRSAADYLDKGSNVNHQIRFTRVYVKRQGRWQLVAQQTSLIEQQISPK